MMSIKDIISEKKPAILKKWYEKVLQTYPDDPSGLMKGKKNFFHETVGRLIFESLEGIFLQLTGSGSDREKLGRHLDDIIRVRAIQEFDPSEALSFIFDLKSVLRSELMTEIRSNGLYEDLMDFESRIDDICAQAFDIYMKCREKLFDLKANEMRNWTYRIVKRSNMVREISPEDSAPVTHQPE
jgi:hypothetical protein